MTLRIYGEETGENRKVFAKSFEQSLFLTSLRGRGRGRGRGRFRHGLTSIKHTMTHHHSSRLHFT